MMASSSMTARRRLLVLVMMMLMAMLLLARTATASAVTSMLASMPVENGGYDLFRRATTLATCGNVTATVDCCQEQGPIFCPPESGTCFTSDGYIGCCTKSDGCAPKTTCYPHSALQSCDPDEGGCTACTNQVYPYCALETNVVAQQYILYCHSVPQTITHSFTLNAAEIARGSSEAASRSSAAKTRSSTTSATTTGPTSSTTSGTSDNGGGSNNTGAIVGGVIGGLILLALIGVAIFFGYTHYRKTRGQGYASPPILLPGSSELDGSEPSRTASNSISPYSWGGHGHSPVMSNYGQADALNLYPVPYNPHGQPDRWNGSPAPYPQRYSHGHYGDPQHPGWHPIGPLAVVNRTPAPVTPVPMDPAELEEDRSQAPLATGVHPQGGFQHQNAPHQGAQQPHLHAQQQPDLPTHYE